MLIDDLGGHHPVLFHAHLTHSIVGHGIAREYRREHMFYTVRSAGFWCPDTQRTHGRSESLNLEPHPTDAFYITYGGAVAHVPEDAIPGLLVTLQAAVDSLPRRKDDG